MVPPRVLRDERSWSARALDALDAAPDGLAARLLSPLAGLYARGGRLHRLLRPPRPLPSAPPSLGVGNLRVGGTGKTPVVEDLGRRLVAAGWKVTVLSRGYRAEGGGDEPAWLRERGLPTLLDGDRRRAHRRAAEAGATFVLLDDALQARDRATTLLCLCLDRDLERMPRTLPAGPAREGVASALRRASALGVRCERTPWPPPASLRREWETRARAWGLASVLPFRLRPARLRRADGTTADLGRLRDGRAWVLVSGLARPESFERTAVEAGAAAGASLRLPDHAGFDEAVDARLGELLEATPGAEILCPAKNLERLARRPAGAGAWALDVELEWADSDPLAGLGLAGGPT